MNEQSTRSRHERTDINLRGVLMASAAIVLGIALTALASYSLIRLLNADPNGANAAKPVTVMNGPIQRSDPPNELAAFLQEKRQQLHSYGWIDKGAGRIHMPIERAMQRLVEKRRGDHSATVKKP
jgi:hypothetical protein